MNNTIFFESMQSYNNYIGVIIEECENIANLLRGSDVKEGFTKIALFSQGMSWIIEINKLLKLNGYVGELNIQSIEVYLSEINNSLEVGDVYLVADIFEFEIKPFFMGIELYDINELGDSFNA